jgi:polysaccharide deacetylase 2 family uncharacterized protein YibQ
MIQDRKKRQIVRSGLIICSIVLGVILLIITAFGIYHLRSYIIGSSIAAEQYKSFTLSNLENGSSSLQPDSALKGIATPPKVLSQVGSPKIAILLTDLGFSKRATQISSTLPLEIGLGFYPYTTTMKPLLYQAVQRGHEVFLYAPFESGNPSINPGKLPLLITNTPEKNIQNLNRLLSAFKGYTGIYSVPSEIFTGNQDAINPIIEMINNKNLMFVISSKRDNFDKLFKQTNIIFSDITIDAELSLSSIKNNLQQLISVAKLHGKALGYAQSYPITINALLEWIPSLIEQGIELVPVSALRGS